MAKLLVPLGAPDQLKAGEIFLPVQPKPLNTCSSAILASGLRSGLVSSKAPAAPALATPPKTIAVINRRFCMAYSSPLPPVAASLAAARPDVLCQPDHGQLCKYAPGPFNFEPLP